MIKTKTNRKGQSSLEFTILVGFSIILISSMLVVIQNNLEDAEQTRKEAKIEQMFNLVMSELEFAEMSKPIYERTFYLPPELGGHQYNITLYDNREVVLDYMGQRRVMFLTDNVTISGNFDVSAGTNTIKKDCENCTLILNTGEPLISTEPEPDDDTHTITITINPEGAGGIIQPSNLEQTYFVDDTVNLFISTNDGYEFQGWYYDDELIDDDEQTSYTIPENAPSVIEIEARFYEISQEENNQFYKTDGTIYCPDAAPGEKGEVDYIEYIAVDNELLNEMNPQENDYEYICTSLVTDMSYIFHEEESFNQDISSWDTSNVEHMDEMFHGAKEFNQALKRWNTTKVETMDKMFALATIFEQDISSWCVEQIQNEPEGFKTSAGFENRPEFQPKWGETCQS